MIVTARHAVALERLLADEDAGRSWTPVEEVDEDTFTELEMAGLARYETPVRLVPTYLGRALATVLRELRGFGPKPVVPEDGREEDLVVRDGTRLEAPERWDPSWRWLGSEIVAMLDAADRAGRVGPLAEAPLVARGLAARIEDRRRRTESVQLTAQGRAVLDIYRAAEPGLEISAGLAEVIRRTPEGPAPSRHLPTGSHEEHLLEAMRLVAYSVPDSDIYAFTALGQAIKRALETGGFGEGDVLTADLLITLATHVDGGEIGEAALTSLQALGYLDDAGELLPAGEWALEAYRLHTQGARGEVWSFGLEAGEAEVLRTVRTLWQKATDNPDEVPTFARLRREMVDRKVREYKAILEKYGRRLNELPQEKRRIAERFRETRDMMRWYEDNFDLREILYSLESFQLLQSTVDETGREVFRLGPRGEAVADDQEAHERHVPSTAVKAITMTRKTFSAPGLAWYETAREAGLVGNGGPTRAGRLYARLAEEIHRLPHLSRYELMVFHAIPARGATVDDVYRALEGRLDDERIHWALEKLEARRLIEMLPDGNVVETEAGEVLDRALAGVPEGFGHPVTPLVVRLLRALREVGTLYVKEKRVRILPRNVARAIRLSGLSREAWENAMEAARVAGFVGRNSVTEAGLLLLEVTERINPRDDLRGYAEPDA